MQPAQDLDAEAEPSQRLPNILRRHGPQQFVTQLLFWLYLASWLLVLPLAVPFQHHIGPLTKLELLGFSESLP